MLFTLLQDFNYTRWKRTCKIAVQSVQLEHVRRCIEKKSTLSWWTHFQNSDLPAPCELFPPNYPSHLKLANKLRCQLLTNTYPTQKRLATMKKADSPTCKLCAREDEDTTHLLVSCPALCAHRSTLLHFILNLDVPEETKAAFTSGDPKNVALSILLPLPHISFSDSALITTHCLRYILKIHSVRHRYLAR